MARYVFLTEKFYSDYSHCPEIECKPSRPHVQVTISVSGVLFCIPFRSHIRHKYAIITDPVNSCGIDFSKAVVITSPADYIDSSSRPYIRENEYAIIRSISDYQIQSGLLRYISAYKKARSRMDITRNRHLVSFSTLQYFEEYI